MDRQQQFDFQYEPEQHILPEEISEKIATDGADSVSTSDLATLLFESKAAEAIDALQAMVSGNGDIRSIPTDNSRIVAALELLRRIFCNRSCKGPAEIFQYIRHYAYESPSQEVFLVVLLNGAHELIKTVVVSKGLVNRTICHPREVFAEPLMERATAVVLCHNHPSGNLEPSSDDLDVTLRMRRAGQLLGIEVLDHIIFSQVAYRSLAESGELL